MKIEYVSNASCLITLADGRTILTDPWYSGGIYYGSWYNFPPLSETDKSKYLALRPDWIYVSHLHPDHLDHKTLSHFDNEIPILIGKLPHNHLHRNIASLGFESIIELELEKDTIVDGIQFTVFGPFDGTSDGTVDEVDYVMDTSLLVRDADGVCIFNINDNPIKPRDAETIKKRYGQINIGLIPYSGASLYPHAARNYSDEEKSLNAKRLTERTLDQFIEITRILKPDVVVPVAGSYVMGGNLANYSAFLHQATPSEIKTKWQESKIENGRLFNLSTGDQVDHEGILVLADNNNFRDFSASDRLEYSLTLKDLPLAHEQISIPGEFRIPWSRLLFKARRNLWTMQQKLSLRPECDVEIHNRENDATSSLMFAFAMDRETPYSTETYSRTDSRDKDRDFIAFYIDERLLLMALVGAAIWNNIEIGALVDIFREPDTFNPTVHSLMSYFTL